MPIWIYVKGGAAAGGQPSSTMSSVLAIVSMTPALVGMTATTADPLLRSSDAYDVAYHHLYHLLPDCGPECCCTGLMRTL